MSSPLASTLATLATVYSLTGEAIEGTTVNTTAELRGTPATTDPPAAGPAPGGVPAGPGVDYAPVTQPDVVYGSAPVSGYPYYTDGTGTYIPYGGLFGQTLQSGAYSLGDPSLVSAVAPNGYAIGADGTPLRLVPTGSDAASNSGGLPGGTGLGSAATGLALAGGGLLARGAGVGAAGATPAAAGSGAAGGALPAGLGGAGGVPGGIGGGLPSGIGAGTPGVSAPVGAPLSAAAGISAPAGFVGGAPTAAAGGMMGRGMMMPMMPMGMMGAGMGGMGAGGQDGQGGQREPWLVELDNVWGQEAVVTQPVIGEMGPVVAQAPTSVPPTLPSGTQGAPPALPRSSSGARIVATS